MYTSFSVFGYLHDDINRKEVLMNRNTIIQVETKGTRYCEDIIVPIRVCNLFSLCVLLDMKKGDRIMISGTINCSQKKKLQLYADEILNCELKPQKMKFNYEGIKT